MMDSTPEPTAAALPRDATDDEIESLPHVVDRIPFAAWAVILAGAAERFTYFGVIAPWQNYMQHPIDSTAIPGALGLGQSTAVNIYNAFFLFSFLSPVLFAIVSDVYLGRFKTLMLGLSLYFAGCVVLVITSLPKFLADQAGVPGLAVSLILIGLGAGSIKATFFPFLGDQYQQSKPQLVERKSGELVIVHAGRTIQFMYNAYYWFTNVASLSSIPVTFLELHYDFWAAYLLATAAMCLAIVLFLVWSPKLNKIVPAGNILPKATNTLLCAARNGFKLDHARPEYQETHRGKTVPWTNHFVDEMSRGLIACRVIFSLVIFYLCINQMYNNLVSQAGQMQLEGVPNDMIQAFSGVACVLCGPVIQLIYEALARRKINFGPVARITTSFLFCGAGMAYAAGLQKLIYSQGPCYEFPLSCPGALAGGETGDDGEVATAIPNEISVWAQLPVYVLLAIAEIFGFVTAFEYSYSKAPKEMKSLVQAVAQLTAGLASLLGMAMSPAAKDPNMVIFYSSLAGAMGAMAALFWWLFRKYDAIDAKLDQLDHHVEAVEGAEVGPVDVRGDSEKSGGETV